MNTSSPKQTPSPPARNGLSSFARALMGGLLVFLATGAFLFFYPSLFDDEMEGESPRSTFAKAEIIFAHKAAQNGIWAEIVAQRVRGANNKQALALLAYFTAQLPDLRLALYDGEGRLMSKAVIPPVQGEPAAQVPPLVKRALYGAWGYGFSEEDGSLTLTAVAPAGFLRNSFVIDDSAGPLGVVRVVAVSTPLNAAMLKSIGEELNADISVLTLQELLKEPLFRDAGAERSSIVFTTWERFADVVHKPLAPAMKSGNQAAAGPLRDSAGAIGAALVAVPLAQPSSVLPLKPLLAIAAGAGGIAALFLVWGLRRDALAALVVPPAREEQAGVAPPGDGGGEPEPASLDRLLAEPAPPLPEGCPENLHNIALPEFAASGRLAYQRYFDFAPYGAFQATTLGMLLHVNQQFASLLGFESAGHLLTNRENLCDFAPQPEDGQHILRQLLEAPGVRHEVFFSLRGGGVKAFWIISIAAGGANECPTMEGFLIDRSPDILLEHCYREYTAIVEERSSLALLLASTSRQFQTYILGERRASVTEPPFPDRRGVASSDVRKPAPAEENLLAPLRADEERISERRQGAFLLKTVFDDIYQIAIDEAEVATVGIAPVNMQLLMEQLHSQVFPVMRARGMTLRNEVAVDLVPRLSCSAALLRHILLRSLLVVTEGVQGGSTHVSIYKSGESQAPAGVFELTCSISWEAGSPGVREAAQEESAAETAPVPSDAAQRQAAPAGMAEGTASRLDLPSLGRNDEFQVIRFLVQKLGGELIEGAQTRESRSLKIVMNFECIEAEIARICVLRQGNADTASQEAHPSADASSSPLPVCGTRAGDLKKQAMALAEESLDLGRALSVANLDLLVMDDTLAEGSFGQQETAQGRGLDILLVEDSLNNRLLFSLYLRDAPHRITEARNGEEGVELFREKQFDIIFMDMEMPLMDGYQATRIIRALEADERRPATPIVAQTAHVLPEFKQQCVQAGCSDFLSKPFSKNALLTLLDAVVQLKYAS